jgi:hypothetical protein
VTTVIVILLAALGILLWLVLGALGAGLWSRRTFSTVRDVFAVKCRFLDDTGPPPTWPRRASYARWVHDVLIVHQGIALVRKRLHLDGGEAVEVAAASSDRDALIGPVTDRVTKSI